MLYLKTLEHAKRVGDGWHRKPSSEFHDDNWTCSSEWPPDLDAVSANELTTLWYCKHIDSESEPPPTPRRRFRQRYGPKHMTSECLSAKIRRCLNTNRDSQAQRRRGN